MNLSVCGTVRFHCSLFPCRASGKLKLMRSLHFETLAEFLTILVLCQLTKSVLAVLSHRWCGVCTPSCDSRPMQNFYQILTINLLRHLRQSWPLFWKEGGFPKHAYIQVGKKNVELSNHWTTKLDLIDSIVKHLWTATLLLSPFSIV